MQVSLISYTTVQMLHFKVYERMMIYMRNNAKAPTQQKINLYCILYDSVIVAPRQRQNVLFESCAKTTFKTSGLDKPNLPQHESV